MGRRLEYYTGTGYGSVLVSMSLAYLLIDHVPRTCVLGVVTLEGIFRG